MLVLKFWRELLILALSAACYFIYHTRTSDPCPPVPELIQEKTETKQIVKTVTTKPDGTKEEKTVKTVKVVKEKTKTADKSNVGGRPLSRYDVHASFRPGHTGVYSVGVGARLGNLPAFGTTDYEIYSKTFLLGLRVEF